MQEDSERGGVRSQNDDFGGSAVEGFGCWIFVSFASDRNGRSGGIPSLAPFFNWR